MPRTLEIPADAIADVRLALLARLGDATEQISHALTIPDHQSHPDWLAPGRELFEDVCALLDEIGWDATLRSQATTIELATHGQTLRVALEHYLPLVENWRDEAAPDYDPPAGPAQLAKHEQHVQSVTAMQALLALL
jgi:hypothetical protein